MNITKSSLSQSFQKLKTTLRGDYENLLTGLKSIFYNLRNIEEFKTTYAALDSVELSDCAIEDVVQRCEKAFKGREKFIHERNAKAFLTSVSDSQADVKESEDDDNKDDESKVTNPFDLFGAMYDTSGVDSLLLYNTLSGHEKHKGKLNQMWNHIRSVLQHYSVEKLFNVMPNNMIDKIVQTLTSDNETKSEKLSVKDVMKGVKDAMFDSNILQDLKDNPDESFSKIMEMSSCIQDVQGIYNHKANKQTKQEQHEKMKQSMLDEFILLARQKECAELDHSKLIELFHAFYDEDLETYNSFVLRGLLESSELEQYREIFIQVYVTLHDGRSGDTSSNSILTNMLPSNLSEMMSVISNNTLNIGEQNADAEDTKELSENARMELDRENIDQFASQLPEGMKGMFGSIMSELQEKNTSSESLSEEDMMRFMLDKFMDKLPDTLS